MENNLKNICVYTFLAVHLKLTQYCYCKSIALQFKKRNTPPLMTLEQSINKHWLDLALLVLLSADMSLVVRLLSHLWLFATPWTAARQASLSLTISRSLLKLTSIELVMPFSHLILCHPLLLRLSIFPSIRVFCNESALHIRWPKYWSFNFSISPSSEYSGLISFRIDWFDFLAVQGTLKSLL